MTDTNTAAAQTLRATLEALQPAASQTDARIRQALRAAVRALERGEDPRVALARVYR